MIITYHLPLSCQLSYFLLSFTCFAFKILLITRESCNFLALALNVLRLFSQTIYFQLESLCFESSQLNFSIKSIHLILKLAYSCLDILHLIFNSINCCLECLFLLLKLSLNCFKFRLELFFLLKLRSENNLFLSNLFKNLVDLFVYVFD